MTGELRITAGQADDAAGGLVRAVVATGGRGVVSTGRGAAVGCGGGGGRTGRGESDGGDGGDGTGSGAVVNRSGT